MASFRKKYAETSPRQDDPPVSVPPTGAAKPPEPAIDVKPPPEMEEKTESPADAAAKSAMRERLREMENAETLTRQAQQQPQYAEPPQPQQQQPQQPAMPSHIERWLDEHPEYKDPSDQVAQAEIYTATLKCNRDGKNWDQPDFIPTLERHLGLRQQQPRPRPQPQQPQPQPRYETPPARQQQRSNVPMSAPPSREPASMSTGRPQSFRAPLTKDELEIAQASGITPERYAQEKEKMLKMKAAGLLDDRR
jgi:hypothetical protein